MEGGGSKGWSRNGSVNLLRLQLSEYNVNATAWQLDGLTAWRRRVKDCGRNVNLTFLVTT